MCAYPNSRLTARDGTQVAYERKGSGSIVLLVHGGFLDHRAWCGLQAILAAAGHTVIAPDRRGHGFSDPYGPRHEVADDAEDLAEIIAAVAEPGTTVRVIAHSSGCHSAIAAAALTDLIGDLVLYEPPQRTEDPPINSETWTRLRNAHAARDRKLLVELALAEVVGKATGHPPPVPLPPPFWDAPFGQFILANALSIPAELEASSRQDDSDDSLRQIHVPIWCLIGQNSPPYNREFSDRFAALNPLAQVIELPDQDHGAPMSNPVIVAELLETLHY